MVTSSVGGIDRKCHCENIILSSGSPWPVHWSKVERRSIERKRDKISWFPLNVFAYKSSLSASNRRDIRGVLVSIYYTLRLRYSSWKWLQFIFPWLSHDFEAWIHNFNSFMDNSRVKFTRVYMSCFIKLSFSASIHRKSKHHLKKPWRIA